jgi:hypothetical protein
MRIAPQVVLTSEQRWVLALSASVAQFGGKHPSAKPWRGVGQEYSRSLRTMAGTPIGRLIRLDSNPLYTCFTRVE